ncbi:hypothetical protein ACP8HI_12490 [Paenibacillus sp. FA6]|uniref:hypothetical protein n=1 Tax=Paenibacillus sp. FA6 TaxID=3413029 RepID=UPI003F659951
MDKVNIKDFFDRISNGQKVNFEYIHEQGMSGGNYPYKSKMKYYSKEAIKEFDKWNSKGYGIYFLPNGGGYKDEDITEYRSCFADLDIKDEIKHEINVAGFKGDHIALKGLVTNKFNSLNISERLQYKQIFLNRIDELKLKGIPPSAVIETKNGYHIYYFMNKETQEYQFETLQGLLIYSLNADTSVKNPARLLRVPDTEHLKDPNEPFTILINEWNSDIRYDADNMISILRGIVEQREQGSLLCVNPQKKSLYRVTTIPKGNGLPSRRGIDYSSFDIGNIALISRGFEGLHELKERLGLDSQLEVRYIDRNEIRQHLKKQNLMELLGIPDRYYCLFHNSSNPSSGSIYIHEGKYFYKCHSSCGVHHDIIQIIERVTRLPIHKSFDYLKELYNIAEIKTEWQQDQEKLIEINIDIIEQFRYDKDLRQCYPYLTKFLDTKGTLRLLIQIHEIARRKLPQLAKITDMNNAIIFAPMNMVVDEILNQKDGTLNNIDNSNTKAVIMIFMYLLNCIGLEQLPDILQQKAKEFQRKGSLQNGKVVHYKSVARYYEIVSLDADRLILAEEMAQFFYQKKLTISGFNREQVFRVCGSEEANRVFPDRMDEEISEMNESIAQELQKLVMELIEEKSWTTDREIMNQLVIPNFDIKQEFRKTFKYIKGKESEAIDSLHIKDDDSSMLKWYANYIKKKLVLNMPAIILHSELAKSRVNKDIRMRLDIPEYIKGFVYHIDQIVELETVHIEDRANKIKRLKLEDSNLSYSKIATIVECTRQYVSKILKESS